MGNLINFLNIEENGNYTTIPFKSEGNNIFLLNACLVHIQRHRDFNGKINSLRSRKFLCCTSNPYFFSLLQKHQLQATLSTADIFMRTLSRKLCANGLQSTIDPGLGRGTRIRNELKETHRSRAPEITNQKFAGATTLTTRSSIRVLSPCY